MRGLRVAAIVLSAVGIGIATYLTIVHAAGDNPLCLSSSHGCETVASSRYAALGGIRVSVFGIAGYAVLLVLACLSGWVVRSLALAASLIAVIFSAYLTYLELNVIHAICQWCVTSAVVSVVLLGVNATWTVRENALDTAVR